MTPESTYLNFRKGCFMLISFRSYISEQIVHCCGPRFGCSTTVAVFLSVFFLLSLQHPYAYTWYLYLYIRYIDIDICKITHRYTCYRHLFCYFLCRNRLEKLQQMLHLVAENHLGCKFQIFRSVIIWLYVVFN